MRVILLLAGNLHRDKAEWPCAGQEFGGNLARTSPYIFFKCSELTEMI